MADINQVSVKGTVYDIADETVRSELADSLAIVANGNTHVAIAEGQFVYVRNHSSLANGLYTAKSAISANATLSTTNLQADTQGGLNALNSKIISDVGTAYMRTANGVQICWGNNTPARANANVAQSAIGFPVEFNAVPRVIAIPHSTNNGTSELSMNTKIGTVSKSDFVLVEQSPAGAFSSSSDVRSCDWIAIGTWK